MDIIKGISIGMIICINDSIMRFQRNLKLFQPEIVLLVPMIIESLAGKLKEDLLERQAKSKGRRTDRRVNNPADTREVLLLKKELEAFQISDSMICQDHFTGRLTLGEIQSAYTGFIKSLTEYRDFLKLDLYKEKEEAARRELNEYQIYISQFTQ